GYLALEPSSNARASNIVRYDAASGEKTILVPAEKLVPTGASSPLVIEQFDLAADGQKVLLFTNSERVWRSNTRGDYWVVNLKTWDLRKLGGEAVKPSTLMFAKFSPDGRSVGYVRENNIFVETLDEVTRPNLRPLTTDSARSI